MKSQSANVYKACDMTMASLPHLGRINQEVLNLAFSVPPPTSSKPPSRSLPIAALMGFLGAIQGRQMEKFRKELGIGGDKIFILWRIILSS